MFEQDHEASLQVCDFSAIEIGRVESEIDRYRLARIVFTYIDSKWIGFISANMTERLHRGRA